MLVSIIIASYNYADYVGKTLESIISQTHKDWECIVVDDGSQDKTREVVANYIQFDQRIIYLYQENLGQAAARNKAVKMAKGKYVQFLDADDLLESFKIEYQLEFLESHKDIDLVYGETRYFRDGFSTERLYSLRKDNLPWMPKISGKGMKIIELLLERNIFTISSPLTRKAFIDKVGTFDTNRNLIEDWDYWMRCAIANINIQYLEIEGTKDLIRIHPLSVSQNLKQDAYKLLFLRKKFSKILSGKRLREINASYFTDNEPIWIREKGSEGILNLRNGNLIEGIFRLYEAFSINPYLAVQIFFQKIFNRN